MQGDIIVIYSTCMGDIYMQVRWSTTGTTKSYTLHDRYINSSSTIILWHGEVLNYIYQYSTSSIIQTPWYSDN